MASENENALLITDKNEMIWVQECRAVAIDISIIQNNTCVAVGEFDLNQPSATYCRTDH